MGLVLIHQISLTKNIPSVKVLNRHLRRKNNEIKRQMNEHEIFQQQALVLARLHLSYFASQCTPVINKSKLHSFKFKTSKRIEKITFTDDDINLIIKNLNVNKAHGWNDISIRMIKFCGKSIALPSSLVFQSIINDGVFPDDWKKVMLFHVIKRTVKT